MTSLLSRSLSDISASLIKGEISSVALTQLYLDRIAALNPRYQAYIHVCTDTALDQAARADAAYAAGRLLGPLHGLPLAVKDLCETDFAPTSNGMACLRDNHTHRQSQVVANLLAAGAVCLGKLAMAEGACSTHHPDMPVPINPHGEKFRVGSSSSGSGVAVAAGLCAAAIGSDTGGSIRFPSAYCGIVGLKPTHGLVSCDGVMPMSPSLDHIGPMATDADGCKRLLIALLGDQATPLPPQARIKSVSYVPDLCEGTLHSEIASAYLAMVDRLRPSFKIIPRRLPVHDDINEVWTTICAYEIARGHVDTFARHEARYGQALADLIRQGQQITKVAYDAAKARQAEIHELWLQVLPEGEAFLLPIHGAPPPLQDNSLGAPSHSLSNPLLFTQTANVTGFPAVAVPAGKDTRGCPIGLQLIGRPNSDFAILDAVTLL